MQQELAIPSITSRQVQSVKQYIPETFAPLMEIVLPARVKNHPPYRAAIMSVADYLLHMSVVLPDEPWKPVEWREVSGMAFARNKGHMMTLGWKLNGPNKKSTQFGVSEWEHAFSWLRSNDYVHPSSYLPTFTKDNTYMPKAKLIWVLAEKLGVQMV